MGHCSVIRAFQNDRLPLTALPQMQRFLSPAAIGAALITLCASTSTWSEEIEQSSAPAQPPAWTSVRPSSNTGNDATQAWPAPGPGRREESADSGGALFMPFSNTPVSTGNAPALHHAAPKASQGGDAADIALTLVAVLAGVGAVAWLLRRA